MTDQHHEPDPRNDRDRAASDEDLLNEGSGETAPQRPWAPDPDLLRGGSGEIEHDPAPGHDAEFDHASGGDLEDADAALDAETVTSDGVAVDPAATLITRDKG